MRRSYDDIKTDPKVKAERIQAVLNELSRYEGEEIWANEHPLWLAVVELEKVCRFNTKGLLTNQPFKLWREACHP